jgi:HPt (histidine-containing phosphotransfer) domain-containing protein
LLVSIDGDMDAAREFAGLFESMGRDTLRGLMDAIDNADAAAVARSAHEIKGACANLRARRAAQAAARLEQAARDNESQELRQLAGELDREVHHAIRYLTAKLA